MVGIAEDAFSDTFQVGVDSVINGMKTAPFHFIKTVLTKVKGNENLRSLFNRDVEQST